MIVLTEFVPGPSRAAFLEQLRAGGLSHVLVSNAPSDKGFNHLLIAAREPLSVGPLAPPPGIDPHVCTNALHARLPGRGLDVLGIRIPDFSRMPGLRRSTWDWIEAAASLLGERSAVILGDFNTDPAYPPSRCGDRFQRMAALGWQHAAPPEGASYWTPRRAPRRLDHALASPRLDVNNANYVTSVHGYTLAGGEGALSDHAALVVDVDEAKEDPESRGGLSSPDRSPRTT